MENRKIKCREKLSHLLRRWFPDKYAGRKELALAEHLDRKIRPLQGIVLSIIAVGSGVVITLTAVGGYMREAALVAMLIKDDVARGGKIGSSSDTQRLLEPKLPKSVGNFESPSLRTGEQFLSPLPHSRSIRQAIRTKIQKKRKIVRRRNGEQMNEKSKSSGRSS